MWGPYHIAEQLISGKNDYINVLKNMYDDCDELYLKHCCTNHFLQNEYYTRLYFLIHNIPIKNYEYPSDYSNSKNGLLRFDKDFVELGDYCNIISR